MTAYGEGNYGLSSIKEIRVSSEFLELEQDTRHCQTETSINTCITELYLKALLTHCSCLPLSLRSGYKGEDVSHRKDSVGTLFPRVKIKIFPGENLLCWRAGLCQSAQYQHHQLSQSLSGNHSPVFSLLSQHQKTLDLVQRKCFSEIFLRR